MTLARSDLVGVVLDSLREEVAEIPGTDTDLSSLRLVGQGALLKSVNLVAMLVGIEQRLGEQYGIEISLMDERAMSQTRSPFRSVATLVEYLEQLLADSAR
ncbi:MAG: hypothetical protein FJ387_28825 [Verrucomicrobia bacterium]|nr:hypothetical protein [Verrucomicrobiota bacterium]